MGEEGEFMLLQNGQLSRITIQGYGPNVIALDACTAHSGKVNVIVREDDLPDQAAEDERFREVTQRILEEHKAAFLELA